MTFQVTATSKANNHFESEYNVFGYDPFGAVAHLSHCFFGPEWKPTTYAHLRGLPTITGQPRYGQPAPSQAQLLPTSFTPRPPPLYFEIPSPGSYVDGPLVFDRHMFAALLLRPLPHTGTDPSEAPCYKDIHGMEVMNGGVGCLQRVIDTL
jgi:hypothetical protein